MNDLISRQAAIDSLGMYIYNVYKAMTGKRMPTDKCIQAAESVLGELPTVHPKHGRWIEIKNKKGVVIAIKCDKCSQFPKHGVRSDFCPNCGADMRCSENPNS